MARTPRKRSESDIDHIIIRGVGQQILFEDDEDRGFFMGLLGDAIAGKEIQVLAWCLMANHVHMLIAAPIEAVSVLMKTIESRYANHFNSRHERVGTLFQGRFTSIPIEGDEQLLSTVSYIHHNPAKAGYGLDVKWSSYRDYIGTGECLVTSTEFVLEVFGSVDEFVRFHALQQEDDQAGIPRSRIPESQALEVAKTVLGRLSPYDVKAQGKEQRNACIVALYNAGLSARQISRITSIGTGIIYRAIK